MAKRPYEVTEARIARLLKEGRGTGARRDYKPWLTIHDVPSHGRSTRIKGAVTGRVHHFLSDIETAIFMMCDRNDDVLDIREQYPLPREETRSIAMRAGIRHPAVRGVDIVVTTDLLVDLRHPEGSKQVAFSAKPARLLDDERTIERLEIERRFWMSRDIPFRIITDAEISKIVIKNLRMLHEWRWLEGLVPPPSGTWDGRAETVREKLTTTQCRTLRAFFREVEKSEGWEAGGTISAIRRLASLGLISIDLHAGLNHNGPLSQLILTENSVGNRNNVLAA